MTEYDRRGPNDRAEIEYRAMVRAQLLGVPHYVMSNAVESWVAGQAAKDNFWANVPPMVTYNQNGERV